MKHLLEKWAALEPSLCKRETRPNKDWHEEFEDYYIQTDRGWERVYTDGDYNSRINKDGLMWIQWAVQQAIIEKGWYIEMYYTPSTYNEAIITVPSKTKAKAYSQNSMAEALLDSYLKVLNADS